MPGRVVRLQYLWGALLAVLMSAGSAVSRADVPAYDTLELQVRANFTVNGGGFNLPGDVFFANATPTLNDAGDVGVRLDVIGSTNRQGIWVGAGGAGLANVFGNGLLADAEGPLGDHMAGIGHRRIGERLADHRDV